MNIIPTEGYLLIEQIKPETETASGLSLVVAEKDAPQDGIVICVGEGEAPAKKGEHIIFKQWSGNDIKIDNKEYIFVKFEDVLAVYEANK